MRNDLLHDITIFGQAIGPFAARQPNSHTLLVLVFILVFLPLVIGILLIVLWRIVRGAERDVARLLIGHFLDGSFF